MRMPDTSSLPRPWLVPSLLLAVLIGAGAAHAVYAALQIEITSGVRDPIPIAIVPFAPAPPADGGLDVAAVVQHDLEGSGRFKALPRERMPAQPTRPEAISAADWKGAGSDYVVVGRVAALEGGSLAVEFDLVTLGFHLHLFAKLAGEVADQPCQTAEERADGHQPHRHGGLLQLRRDARQMSHLSVE